MYSIETSKNLSSWKTLKQFASFEYAEALNYFNTEKEKISKRKMKAVRLTITLSQHNGHPCIGCNLYKGEDIDCGGNGC